MECGGFLCAISVINPRDAAPAAATRSSFLRPIALVHPRTTPRQRTVDVVLPLQLIMSDLPDVFEKAAEHFRPAAHSTAYFLAPAETGN